MNIGQAKVSRKKPSGKGAVNNTLCSYRLPSDIKYSGMPGVNGKSEFVFYLMPKSMVCRLDPLSIALFSNSYGIRNRPQWE
jgi:hypothetical protein